MFEYAKDLIKWTRDVDKKVFINVGGYHAILAPEEFENVEGVDGICIGEGEYPTLELMQKMEKGEDYTGIPSWWFIKDGKTIKNPVRPLIENLDDLPFPDFDLFDYKNLESTKTNSAIIILSRGCLYNCTYCGNAQFRNIYPNKSYNVSVAQKFRLVTIIFKLI